MACCLPDRITERVLTVAEAGASSYCKRGPGCCTGIVPPPASKTKTTTQFWARLCNLDQSNLQSNKKRPPSLTGAKLPWFSRVTRAFLAAWRRGSRRRGNEPRGRSCSALWPLRTCQGSMRYGVARLPGPPNCFPSAGYARCWYAHRLVAGIAGCGRLGIAESHSVHTVDGNLVFCYQIALDRFIQTLGL